MEEFKTLGVASLAVVVFLFTGCTPPTETEEILPNSPPEQTTTSQAQVSEPSPEEESPPTSTVPSNEPPSITLFAEAIGDGKVFFNWELSEGLEAKEKYRIIRSEKPNPEFNRKNYWVQVDKAFDEFTWTALTPNKTKHFRLCIFDNEKEKCELYSNNVELEIQ